MSFGRSTAVPFEDIQQKKRCTHFVCTSFGCGRFGAGSALRRFCSVFGMESVSKLTLPLCLCHEFFCHNGDPFMDSGTDLLMFVICCNL